MKKSLPVADLESTALYDSAKSGNEDAWSPVVCNNPRNVPIAERIKNEDVL